MAGTSTKPLNVYQRLQAARQKFLEANVEKTGKNMHLAFKYFELEDIVPTATKIFSEVGLTQIIRFNDNMAVMTIYNLDNPDDNTEVFAPFNQIQPIVSREGKNATNEMQALGASITYMRRYLYLIALDICEPDQVDATKATSGDKPVSVAKAETKAAEKKAAPATAEQRKTAKVKLTSPAAAEQATDEQKKELMKLCKELIQKDGSQNELVQKIALATKSFTDLTAEQFKTVSEQIKKMLDEYEKNGRT